MPISRQVNANGTTTITLTYTAQSANMDAFLTDAAKYWYGTVPGHGVVLGEGETVDDLTLGEIGQIIEYVTKWNTLEAAKTHHVLAAQATARETAQAETGTRYF